MLQYNTPSMQTKPEKHCKLCDKEFSRPYCFKRHLKNIHGFTYDDYIDSIYDNITIDSSSKTTNRDNSTFLNTINSSNITDNSSNTVNSNIKPIICTKCNKTFARKWNLTEHSKRCKGVIDKLSCHYCNKIFTHEKSRFKHFKTCKTKKEIESRALSNTSNNDNSDNQNENNSSSISQQTADTINNNIQQNNTTNNTTNTTNNNTTINNNYVLTFPDNGDNNFEFNIDHITNTIMKNLLKKVQDPYYKFNNFFDKLMDEPSNRIIKKSSPNTSYSQIHKGDGNWELGYDKDIYKTLTHHVTVAAFDKIDNIKKDVKLAKELYHNLMNFATYVEQVNEMDYDSSEYNDITSRIKLIIINLSRRWESQK